MKKKLLWFKKQYNKWWDRELTDTWQLINAIAIGLVLIGTMIASFWLFLFLGLPWILFFGWLRYEKIGP